MAKIVIIGGGFGGLNFLHKAKKSENEFILIDKTNHHLFQPLLYQVATAVLSPADIAVPIRHLFNNDKNVNVILGEVKDIDKNSNLLTLDDGEIISYDYLIISVGSKHSYFGKNDWSKYSNGLKIINDALDIRDRILKAFEKAEKEKDELKRQEYLNFVIVGAGPTGVEMAGSIAEIAFKNMKKEYRNFDTLDANVYLIEAGPKILSMFSEKLATKAEQYLKDLGVTVRKNEKVINIKKNILTTESSEIATDNIIWAAGNEASPLIKKLDTDTDLQGRALVNEYCLIKDSNNIFVIGDASNFKNKNNKSLPGIAPVAIQQGRYLAKMIKSNTKDKETKPFKYTDKGMMATVGKFKAVGVVGNLEITGLIAWLFWSLIHIVYLIGYRTKILVAIQWTYAYFFNKRGTRLIYRDIDR
ncbi:NAD(P)/FAD-dependent oxidoreductase [bacterium]|nr:NAD(P)/FAD-dependent oxidoreductase [bacterium]